MRIASAIILLIGLAVVTFAQPNYQLRVIFDLGGADYACKGGRNLDYIDVIINFDGSNVREFKNVSGNTECYPYGSTPETILWPSKSWYEIGDDYEFFFDQATLVDTLGQKTYKIRQNSTVRNPVVYQKKKYNCIILGDGKEQHFGTNYTQYPPAKVYLKCDSNPAHISQESL